MDGKNTKTQAQQDARGIIREGVHVWHVLIAGFTQREGRPTGLHKLWLRMRRMLVNQSCAVELREWNSRWDGLAESIWLTSYGLSPTIYVHAYSYGAGWGFMRLARELRKRGLRIRLAVLSDPVYRHPLWSLAWLSLLPDRRICVPPNVQEVRWFYQRLDRPAGHEVYPESPLNTLVHKGVQLDAAHAYMDDAPEFHDAAISAAAGESL